MFCTFLAERYPAGTVKNYMNHCAYLHEFYEYTRPIWDSLPWTHRVRRSLTRRPMHVTPKKQPVTYPLSCRLIDTLDLSKDGDLVFATILLFGILGLFRLGELLRKSPSNWDERRILRRGHVSRFTTTLVYYRVWLPYSKTDLTGNGCPVYIPSTTSPQYCPVTLMDSYLERVPGIPTDPLFRWPSGTPVTTGSFIRKLKRHLLMLDIDPDDYSGHSLRKGGACTAARAGLSDEMIKMLGRWTSDCFRRYTAWLPADIQQLNSRLQTLGLLYSQ